MAINRVLTCVVIVGASVLFSVDPISAQSDETFKGRLSAVPVTLVTLSTTTGSGTLTAVLEGSTLAIDGEFDGMNSPRNGCSPAPRTERTARTEGIRFDRDESNQRRRERQSHADHGPSRGAEEWRVLHPDSHRAEPRWSASWLAIEGAGGNTMRHAHWHRLLAGTAVVALSIVTAGQEPATDGSYTAVQAAAGRLIYDQYCTACHLGDLSGSEGP